MSAVQGADERNVIPRWRPYGRTILTGELGSITRPSERVGRAFSFSTTEPSQAFLADPGVFTAGDLLSQALVGDLQSAEITAAVQYVQSLTGAPEALRQLAALVSSGKAELSDVPLGQARFDRDHMARRVAQMRGILRREPKNSIRWVDLALAHVNLGDLEKARREVLVALDLSPHNRYVLRSAARLFVLLGDPERAQHVLLDSERTRSDPWLMATELAVAEAAERPAKFVKSARHVLDRADVDPWHLGELSSALATIELRNGRIRKARQLMRQALIEPTENVLAQAEWASQHGLERPSTSALDAPLSYEAWARFHSQVGEFDDALRCALAWQDDQPFAPEPAIFASYTASVGTEQYEVAVAAARQGLVASPANLMLRNNLVFALALSRDVESAQEELKALLAVPEAAGHATVVATRGLVAFRSGNVVEGRHLYEHAIDMFRRADLDGRAALAAIFWAREEIAARTDSASDVWRRASDMAARAQSIEVNVWLQRVGQRVK